MRQVFIRRPMAGSQQQNELIVANVIAQNGDMLRVKLDSELTPRDVKASDTLPVPQYTGGATPSRSASVIQQCYPQSSQTLARMLYK